MPAEVKILVQGYTNANEVGETGQEMNCPTITLIRDKNMILVVDPGILESQQILIDALGGEGIGVNDVDFVCITHSHLDHYRNIGMFPNAKVLDYFGVWEKNTVESWREYFSEDIQILRTPGHDYTGISFFVTTSPDSEYPGVVAICGDIFWKENYPENPRDDIYASDIEKLKHSRDEVLKMADWVIPGHGDIYKIKKGQPQDGGDGDGTEIKTQLKSVLTCKKCRRSMEKVDRCLCRPWLCHHCCECGQDCDLCGCNHKK